MYCNILNEDSRLDSESILLQESVHSNGSSEINYVRINDEKGHIDHGQFSIKATLISD